MLNLPQWKRQQDSPVDGRLYPQLEILHGKEAAGKHIMMV